MTSTEKSDEKIRRGEPSPNQDEILGVVEDIIYCLLDDFNFDDFHHADALNEVKDNITKLRKLLNGYELCTYDTGLITRKT